MVTEQTANSMKEIMSEIDGALGDKPLTEDEITYMQSSIKNGYPAGFETTNALLAQQVDVQRYGLPVDWTARYLPAIAGVTTEGANAAFAAAVDPNKLSWMVVGDRPSVLEDIRQLGMPIVVLDRDGNTVEELEPLPSENTPSEGAE